MSQEVEDPYSSDEDDIQVVTRRPAAAGGKKAANRRSIAMSEDFVEETAVNKAVEKKATRKERFRASMKRTATSMKQKGASMQAAYRERKELQKQKVTATEAGDPESRKVIVEIPLGKKKIGINVTDEDGPSFITKVLKGSVADKLGLEVGMQILNISGVDCLDSSQSMVLTLLKVRPVTVELLRPEGAASPTPSVEAEASPAAASPVEGEGGDAAEDDDAPGDGFAGGESADEVAANTERAEQDHSSNKVTKRGSIFGNAAARLKEKAKKMANKGKKEPEPISENETVYVEGWFVKKGKSEQVDDRRRRFMQLVGPKALIRYYIGVDADGKPQKHRGDINLEQGFDFWNDEAKLIIDTPPRTWILEMKADDWERQMDEWLRHLREYREGNVLEWERPLDDEPQGGQAGMSTCPIDTTVPLGTPEPGVLRGWFMKKGKSEMLKDFTRRYHVLDEGACGIHYYKKLKDDTPTDKKGTIELAAGYEVTRTKANDGTESKIQIITPSRTWILIAEDGFSGDKVAEAKIWQRVLMEKRGQLVPALAGAAAPLDELVEEEEDDASPAAAEGESQASKKPPARPAPPKRPPPPEGAKAAEAESVPELTAEEEAAERQAARANIKAEEGPADEVPAEEAPAEEAAADDNAAADGGEEGAAE
mmetsp:Transcript_10705/g.27539  ORF Transcript_10705/g.27539 Transcript_10705/m.27539 type:complete len:654 (-) Transcript_10705:252-2213(-)